MGEDQAECIVRNGLGCVIVIQNDMQGSIRRLDG